MLDTDWRLLDTDRKLLDTDQRLLDTDRKLLDTYRRLMDTANPMFRTDIMARGLLLLPANWEMEKRPVHFAWKGI